MNPDELRARIQSVLDAGQPPYPPGSDAILQAALDVYYWQSRETLQSLLDELTALEGECEVNHAA